MTEASPGYAHRDPHFNYRVAGVCIHDGHVLLQSSEPVVFWVLPGGRPEFGEASNAALAREMREEIGLEISVGSLLWFVENFFVYNGAAAHELTCYYRMSLPEDSPLLAAKCEFFGDEPYGRLIYRWFPLRELATTRLLPSFLRTALLNPPADTLHLIHTDVAE